jgi:pyridoxal phosphate enzyme (YggS family)
MIDVLQKQLSASGVKLIAVSKTYPPENILAVYAEGCRDFGENKVQELVDKYEILPKDIQWHVIGHLQTNKVKYIAPFVAMIHSVDSLRLLAEINKQGAKYNRQIPCLLQFFIAEEDTKFGLDWAEAEELLESPEFADFQHVSIAGVMGMASFTENQEQVRREFDTLKQYFDRLKKTYFANQPTFKEISMGMSGDWEMAVEAGSTMVRIGSAIFGARTKT